MPRPRLHYALLMLATVATGLASRQLAGLLPQVGDALWALVVFLGIGWLHPRLPTRYAALLALAFAWLIEFSQLWQPPWLTAIRHTLPGHLILGQGFDVADLIAYGLGIAAGALPETALLRQQPA